MSLTLAALVPAATAAAQPKNVILVIADGAADKKRMRAEWSTSDHTGAAVPVFAYGPGANAFAGFQDNTDVGKKLFAAVGKN